MALLRMEQTKPRIICFCALHFWGNEGAGGFWGEGGGVGDDKEAIGSFQ